MSGTQKQFSRMITIGKNKIENQRKHTSGDECEGEGGVYVGFFSGSGSSSGSPLIANKKIAAQVPPLYIFGNRLFRGVWGLVENL